MLIMVPFLALMFVVMLRLDERFAKPRTGRVSAEGQPPASRFCGVDQDGQVFLCDPDGTSVR